MSNKDTLPPLFSDEQIVQLIYSQDPQFDEWHEGLSEDDVIAIVRAAIAAQAPTAPSPRCETCAYGAPMPLPVQAEPPADILLRAIVRLNQNPYSLTKSECITELEALRELVKQQLENMEASTFSKIPEKYWEPLYDFAREIEAAHGITGAAK